MGFTANPSPDEIFTTPAGKKFKWNDISRVWEKEEISIVSDSTGTNDNPLTKVWSGTYAEYSALISYSDDIVYFIKD